MDYRAGASIAILALVLGSCATTPPVVREPGAAAAWLGETPRVIVRLDAAQVTAWSQVVQRQAALKAVGSRTKTIWLGLDLENLDDLENAADSVRIVLEGNFPRGEVAFALNWNPGWKKGRVEGVWVNSQRDLSVSLPEDGLVAIRRHDPRPAEAVEGALRDLNAAALERTAVWISFWDPGKALFGSAGARLLPVERLDVMLSISENGFLEGPVLLWFPDDRSAKAASVLLRLFSSQIRARLGQDLVWTVEGSHIAGETLRFDQADLKVLAEKLLADPLAQEASR